MIKFLKKLFTRRKPTYGANIFKQRTWLEKQVEEEQFKRNRNTLYGIKWLSRYQYKNSVRLAF